MWSARRWFVLVAVIANLAMGGNAVGGDVPVGGASTASTGPTSSAGTATVTVHWTASCPDPGGTGTGHYWYVDIDAFHADGSHAGSVSAAEANVNSDSRTQSLLLQMAKGLKQETFSVQVTLNCPPNPVTPIGSHSAALALPKQGGGSGGDGTGGGGTGGGSGGGSGGGTGGGGGGGGGGGHCVVPKLVDKTLSRAKTLLERAHCRLGAVRAPHVGRRVKLVVQSSSPKAGARRPAGTRVDLRLRRA